MILDCVNFFLDLLYMQYSKCYSTSKNTDKQGKKHTFSLHFYKLRDIVALVTIQPCLYTIKLKMTHPSWSV